MNKVKVLISAYVIGIFSLFLYTFTQVDLNLTLSKASIYQEIQKQFQYLGFFNRPSSALILSLILIELSACFLLFIYFSKKNLIKFKTVLKLIILTALVFTFSYTAFSYDLFNYIFDAKIFAFYQQNPYLQKPLDYPLDPMLNFMRWTHRVYPYGPSWLILTVPTYLLGFGFFITTYFLFKALISLSFLGSAVLIYKISQKIFPKYAVLNTVFFVFNPLVIIESLISSHNDIPMIFFLLLSIFLFLQKQRIYGWLSFIFSIGIKFSTGALLPLFIIYEYFLIKKKSINWYYFFYLSIVLSLLTVLIASLRTNFQTWYLIFPLTLSAFVINNKFIMLVSILISFFAASIYIPYVFLSDYVKGYPQVIQTIEITGLVTVIAFSFTYFVGKTFFSKR